MSAAVKEPPVEQLDPPTAFGPSVPIPAEETFTAQDEKDFIFDATLQEIGQRQIELYPEFVHLQEYNVRFAWKRRGGAIKGEPTYGSLVRGNALLRMLGNTDFVVWLAADHCREIDFGEREREALIYHQLAHSAADEYGKPFVQGHDLEMFTSEVERFGLWSLALRTARRTFEQVPLPLGDD